MSQSSQEILPDFESLAHNSALVLQCSIKMIRERDEFKHGVTEKEVTQYFPRLMGFELATYGNRLRDNYRKYGTMGKHDVHGKRHYSLFLDEQSLIDHNGCCNCHTTTGKGKKQ